MRSMRYWLGVFAKALELTLPSRQRPKRNWALAGLRQVILYAIFAAFLFLLAGKAQVMEELNKTGVFGLALLALLVLNYLWNFIKARQFWTANHEPT